MLPKSKSKGSRGLVFIINTFCTSGKYHFKMYTIKDTIPQTLTMDIHTNGRVHWLLICLSVYLWMHLSIYLFFGKQIRKQDKQVINYVNFLKFELIFKVKKENFLGKCQINWMKCDHILIGDWNCRWSFNIEHLKKCSKNASFFQSKYCTE